MPLYELFCLAQPQLRKSQLAEIMRKAGVVVFDKGGVVTDIKSFGDRPLAYDIRKPTGKYSEAAMWEMTFMVQPSALKDVEHELRVDERVLRWLFLKKRAVPKLANTYSVAKHVYLPHAPVQHDPWARMLREQQVANVDGVREPASSQPGAPQASGPLPLGSTFAARGVQSGQDNPFMR